MSTAVLDDRDRVVLPREVVEELGTSKGDVVAFERRGRDFVIIKSQIEKSGDRRDNRLKPKTDRQS